MQEIREKGMQEKERVGRKGDQVEIVEKIKFWQYKHAYTKCVGTKQNPSVT